MSNQLNEFRIGVDIGGTFTDIVAVNQKNAIQFNEKVLTTPKDPSEAVLNGVKNIIEKNKIDLDKLSSMAVEDPSTASNPKKLDKEDMKILYEHSISGDLF